MELVVVRGHGQIARKLGKRLVERGDRTRGVTRNQDQAGELRTDGIEPVVVNLEPPIRHVARGPSPRDAVAAARPAVVDDASTVGRTFEVVGGPEETVAKAAGLSGRPEGLDASSSEG